MIISMIKMYESNVGKKSTLGQILNTVTNVIKKLYFISNQKL